MNLAAIFNFLSTPAGQTVMQVGGNELAAAISAIIKLAHHEATKQVAPLPEAPLRPAPRNE